MIYHEAVSLVYFHGKHFLHTFVFTMIGLELFIYHGKEKTFISSFTMIWFRSISHHGKKGRENFLVNELSVIEYKIVP